MTVNGDTDNSDEMEEVTRLLSSYGPTLESYLERPLPQQRRAPLGAWVLSAAAVIALVVALGSVFVLSSLSRDAEAERTIETSAPAPVETATAVPSTTDQAAAQDAQDAPSTGPVAAASAPTTEPAPRATAPAPSAEPTVATPAASTAQAPPSGTLVAEFAGDPGALSPDGSLLFVTRDRSSEMPGGSLCLLETADGTERFCLDLGQVTSMAWSPGSSLSAVTVSIAVPDPEGFFIAMDQVMLVDTTTGSISNISNPEQASSAFPSFSPSGGRIVFQRDNSVGTDRNPFLLDLYDVASDEIIGSIEAPEETGTFGDLGTAFPPLMLDEWTAIFGAEDQLLAFDFMTGEIDVLLDHTELFVPLPLDGVILRPSLQPIQQLADGRLLLLDTSWGVVFNMTGGREGHSSHAWVADLDQGTVEPLFAPAPPEGGWFGPWFTHSAGGSQLLVSWLDRSTTNPDGGLALSLLDLDVDGTSVVPTDLPVVWIPDRNSFLTWGVSSVGTFAVNARSADGMPTTQLVQLPGW